MAGLADPAMVEFFAESEEILQRVSSSLNEIEKGQHSHEQLDGLYRDMHTMKGSAQLFGLHAIAAVAHGMETCLEPLRKKRQPPGARMLDALYKCVASIEALLEGLKSGQSGSAVEQPPGVLAHLFDATARQFGGEFSVSKDLVLPPEAVVQIAPVDTAAALSAAGAAAPPGLAQAAVRPETEADAGAAAGQAGGTESGDTTIRVQVALLDMLMNLVGEMVLVRNQVLQHSSRSEDLEFLNLSQRLDVVTSELQDQVMKTRMQPIGNILGKFQRVIRDLARDLNKKIDLTLQGKDTELDKTLLEAIKDPLTHIVRNACDHGIEPPEARRRAGKPETGHVSVRAYHEGGQVIVEISDDGAGLNRKRIVAKAIERGILTPESAERMGDREKLNLIFHPGLSTAEKVSSVSGRGVGMDVVKTNIERIGGSVELDSVEGRGSTVRLRIPLTLAIVPAMLVRCGEDEYAIPQIKLVELVRVERDKAGGIQMVQGQPVFELRGKLLPLVDLSRVLHPGSGSEAFESPETVNIVVVTAEGDTYGLIVDEVLDTADIVVKPLSKFLKSLEVFSAATILGSGQVALILDPAGLAKAAHLVLEKKASDSDFHSVVQSAKLGSETVEYLLFRLGEERFALPLATVSRLEDFIRDDVELSGEQPVIQYRNTILPLISVSEVLSLKAAEAAAPETLATIVIQRGERAFGLMVDEILDVFTEEESIDDSIKDRFGVLGNLVHGEEVIVALDAYSIVEREAIKLGGAVANPSEAGQASVKLRILYAEDVGFFRRQVSKLLTAHGFDVVAAEDGQSAFELLRQGGAKRFDLILSDIEMPKMNGFQFARAVRADAEFARVPMVALTTKFSKRDIDEGKAAGFDCYLEKLNADVLIGTLEKILRAPGGKVA